MKKTCNSSVAQNPLAEGRQLELFNHTGNRHKPQISSIPGISVKRRDRYQVVFRDQVLGDHLTLDEAIALVKGGAS
jgi:hypothetical protein